MRRTVCLALFLVVIVPAYAELDVLMAAADIEGDQEDIFVGLSSFADFNEVDWWNMNVSGTPSLSDISGYDAVVTWPNIDFPDPLSWGNTLADYVDEGGVVVVATYAFYEGWYLIGRIMAEGYCPLAPAGGTHNAFEYWETALPDIPGHPFLEGVTELGCGWRDYTDLNSWGHLVTHYKYDGEDALAYNDDYTVAGVNAYPGRPGTFTDWVGDYPRCLRNIIVEMCAEPGIKGASLGEIKAAYH